MKMFSLENFYIGKQAKVIKTTEGSNEAIVTWLILHRDSNGFIQKPFRLEMLSRKVREMLD